MLKYLKIKWLKEPRSSKFWTVICFIYICWHGGPKLLLCKCESITWPVMMVACPGRIPPWCTLTTDRLQNSNLSSSSCFLPHSWNGSPKERVASQTAARGLHFERQPEEEMASGEGHRPRRVWPDLSGYWLVLSVTSIPSWDYSVHRLSLCYSLRGRGQTRRIRYCLCHKNGIHGAHSATDRVLSFKILC